MFTSASRTFAAVSITALLLIGAGIIKNNTAVITCEQYEDRTECAMRAASLVK